MVLAGTDVRAEALVKRRELERKILPRLADPIRYSPELDTALPNSFARFVSRVWRVW